MRKRRLRIPSVALALACLLTAAGCGAPHVGISNGSISACYRALPAARSAVHDPKARLVGVHRVPADHIPPRLRSITSLPHELDVAVCAVAFRGTFAAGQVTGARPGASGKYAVVIITTKHLKILASYVGDRLPRSFRGKLV